MNEIKTRKDLAQLLLDWIRPLKSCYSEGHSMLKVGHTAAHYGEKASRMEGFSRILWGVGPLLATDNEDLSVEQRQEVEEWNRICLDGLIHGTDPGHEEYWGDVCDFDQKMVEMAALVTAILLSPGRMWNPMTQQQQKKVRDWLNQINRLGVHANNWRFFRILVNVLFTVHDLEPDQNRLAEDWQVIENCYDGDGWYYDGNPGQMDYYIPFAMHYYGLIYAHFMKDYDGARCKSLFQRAGEFYKDFVYWFAADGSSVPYGRSLTYRFAHSAFFAAYGWAMAGEDNELCGEVKGMLLRNFRYWSEKPIFDKGGILTIGYGYPNLFMSESYNAPGSPYWSFKAFLALAVPATHPFWQAQEKMTKSVSEDSQVTLSHPHMIIAHEQGHVRMYPVGQHCMEHGNIAAKYEKFVYSDQFGFSVSRGNTLETGAFDNTLAVSYAGENFYRMRYGVDRFQVTSEYTIAEYSIGRKVHLRSIIVPLGKWHVRIHEIDTTEEIDVADGGFAIPRELMNRVEAGRKDGKYQVDMVTITDTSVVCTFPWAVSAACGLVKEMQPKLVDAFPNTNLLYNLTVIPTLCATLQPGYHVLADCFYADDKEKPDTHRMPKVEIGVNDHSYTISCGTDEITITNFK